VRYVIGEEGAAMGCKLQPLSEEGRGAKLRFTYQSSSSEGRAGCSEVQIVLPEATEPGFDLLIIHCVRRTDNY